MKIINDPQRPQSLEVVDTEGHRLFFTCQDCGADVEINSTNCSQCKTPTPDEILVYVPTRVTKAANIAIGISSLASIFAWIEYMQHRRAGDELYLLLMVLCFTVFGLSLLARFSVGKKRISLIPRAEYAMLELDRRREAA